MSTKSTTTKSTKGSPAKEESRPRIEAGDIPRPDPEDFFKTTHEKDRDMHYHWASDDPRRIHALKRKGYEVDPSSSSAEAAQKVERQREFLKRTMHDPDTPKENAAMAKELLNQMDSKPLDTINNIPGHILMRQPMELRVKEMQRREDVLKKMGDKIQSDVRNLDRALKMSGKGGMKSFLELFDSVK